MNPTFILFAVDPAAGAGIVGVGGGLGAGHASHGQIPAIQQGMIGQAVGFHMIPQTGKGPVVQGIDFVMGAVVFDGL